MRLLSRHHLQGVVEVEEPDFEANLEVECALAVVQEAITEVEEVANKEKERRKRILKSIDQIEDVGTGEIAEGGVEEEVGSIIRNH